MEIGVGIIGSGFMGRTHCRGVQLTERARLVAIAGGSRARALASEFGVECEMEVAGLCHREDVHAIVVATPHQLHAEHALMALRAGKHVLVEKPMATTVGDCDLMIREAEQRNLRLALGYHQRFREVNLRAREIITGGRLGKIVDIQAFLVGTGGSKGHPWLQEAAAGGWLLGYGVHVLDLLRWFLGSEPVWLVSSSATAVEDVPVENTTQLLMQFATGERVAFWCTNLAPAAFPGTSCGMWVMGEDGALMLDSFGKLQVARRGGGWETVAEQPPLRFSGDGVLAPERMGAYAALMADFVAACCEGRSPAATGADGRAGVAISLAAYRSGQSLSVLRDPCGR